MNCLLVYYSSLHTLTSSKDGAKNLIGNMIEDVLTKYLENCNLDPSEYATLSSLLFGSNNNEKASLYQTIMSLFKDCYKQGIGPYAIKAFLCLYVGLYDIYNSWPQNILDDINGATCDMLDELMAIDDFSLFIIWSCAAYTANFESYYREKHKRSLFSNLSLEEQQTFSDYKYR